MKRWFYIDMREALDPTLDREEAIVGVQRGRIERNDFGRSDVLDLPTPEKEYAALTFPLRSLLDSSRLGDWREGFYDHWREDRFEGKRAIFRHLMTESLKISRIASYRDYSR